MKVLFIAPPQNNRYFNLCYNFTELGEVSTYIRKRASGVGCVNVLDASVESPDSWDGICTELDKGYDLVAVWNRFDNLKNVGRVVQLAKKAQDSTRVVTYGQPSTLAPHHFAREYPLDVVVKGGHWELVLKRYVDYLNGSIETEDAYGLLIKEHDKWQETANSPAVLDAFWEYADLGTLPLSQYFEIYEKEEKIAGFKGKRELSLSLSRGCPMGCMFCNVNKAHGKRDLRKPVEHVIGYIEENFDKYGFDFVSAFSPIFTLNRDYAIAFSEGMGKRGIEWKCVSHIDYVDDELLGKMSEGGCKRIGFGLETMEEEASSFIRKGFRKADVKNVIGMCKKHGIIPMMFMMLGIPGETRDSFRSAVKFLRDNDAPIRLTAFTPFYEIRDDMSTDEISRYDRESITAKGVKGMSGDEFGMVLRDVDKWAEGEGI